MLCAVPRASEASGPTAPGLPPPSGRIVNVSTEGQLQQAVRSVTSDTTILIAPGTYQLTSTLYVNGSLRNVSIRGASGNRDDVVLAGPGMTNAAYGPTPHGIWTGGGVQNVTIANLTLRDFYFHCVILNAGTTAPRLYNLRLLNAGEQIVKSNPNPAGGGVDDGVVEYSIIEYPTTSRDFYTNGVDVLAGRRWIVRNNLFRNIRAPIGQMAGPAVLMWRGTTDSVTEGNTFIDCQRPIAYGLEATNPPDHARGVIRNNFIYRSASQGGDAGIVVFGSPDTVVAHNSVLLSGTYPAAIEYRFPQATGVQILNNLTDGPIVRRDNAVAVVSGNHTQATPAMFVAPASGDLHLNASALNAIDRAAGVGVSVDWDEQPRPVGAAFDIGADEFSGTVAPPSAPQNLRIIR
jgi:hypothetical protein